MYSVGIAYLLWLVSGFGALGFHRFYLGKIPSGVLWMFTGGMCGIGSIYDFFTLSRQVQEANIRRAIFSRNDPVIIQEHRRYVSAGGTHTKHEKDSIERIILREARENKGIITPSGVALAGNISIEESKKYLDALVSKGFAELRVRKSGGIVYTIPDIMDSNEPLEDI
jgi:predicted transcriptional regulator